MDWGSFAAGAGLVFSDEVEFESQPGPFEGGVGEDHIQPIVAGFVCVAFLCIDRDTYM